FVYNNTVDTGGGAGGSCVGNGESSPRSTTHYRNNHCIAASVICEATGTTCTNDGNNLAQTESQANAAGYMPNQTYAYSPTSASSPTVLGGINLAVSCIGNLGALCNDISYPTYDTVNRRAVMQSVTPRPLVGAWDSGAYQFSAQGSQPKPNAPTGLAAV